jgi:predicted PolB exonuclease-like 3'-5' exonuclease
LFAWGGPFCSGLPRNRRSNAIPRGVTLATVLGLTGKPDGMTGAEVEKYYRDGHVRQIAEYCESDVLNTYRIWLRHELL